MVDFIVELLLLFLVSFIINKLVIRSLILHCLVLLRFSFVLLVCRSDQARVSWSLRVRSSVVALRWLLSVAHRVTHFHIGRPLNLILYWVVHLDLRHTVLHWGFLQSIGVASCHN